MVPGALPCEPAISPHGKHYSPGPYRKHLEPADGKRLPQSSRISCPTNGDSPPPRTALRRRRSGCSSSRRQSDGLRLDRAGGKRAPTVDLTIPSGPGGLDGPVDREGSSCGCLVGDELERTTRKRPRNDSSSSSRWAGFLLALVLASAELPGIPPEACAGDAAPKHAPAVGSRDPQDPPRRDHHAGEPLVRLLFRHLSRRRRDPDAERRCDRLHPDPQTPVCAEPYHDPSDRNAGGPHDTVNAVRDINHGKMDGFQREARQRSLPCLSRHRQPRLLADALVARRDGLPRLARDPELLGLRTELRPPGSHVPGGQLLESAGASLNGLRLVGSLLQARRPDELQVRVQAPFGARAAARSSTFRGPT